MSMKINTFVNFIGDAAKSLKRNKTISIASAATVAATLFIVGTFLLAIQNINQVMSEMESKVEIKIILKDDIKLDEQKAIENKLKNTPSVTGVEYESKAKALENLKSRFGKQYESALEGLEKENPLPASYIVKVEKPELISQVVKDITGMAGIETIKDAKEVVDKIITFSNAIRWIGIIIFVILIGVSLFLIGNTIKLTVYSRRKEINIMKYIGATDWFIRWPFILEGMFIGILGAIVADLLLYYGYKFVFIKMSAQIMMIPLINPAYVYSVILGEFILGGIFIGIVGSIMAIRKFLVV